MAIQLINPSGVHPPAGSYSHGASVHGPGRTLYISGQVGIDTDGKLADGFAGQAAQCWRNIIAVLAADAMTVNHLVKVTTFLTNIGYAAEYAAVRAPFLAGARPASTLVAVAALVRPEWLIEVEAVACSSD